MAFRVDPHSDVPPSRQIVEAFLDRVANGSLTAGEVLPSIRALAAEALVNPNTVGKAYRDLEAMGVVEGRNGSGVFVTPSGAEIARGRRRKATLETFRRAAREALRAGHGAGALEGALASIEGSAAATRGSAKEDDA